MKIGCFYDFCFFFVYDVGNGQNFKGEQNYEVIETSSGDLWYFIGINRNRRPIAKHW